jgi:hypothetical protein
MAKFDVKGLLVQKGERIALGIGAAVAVLLVVLGGLAAANSENSSAKAELINKQAAQIDTALANGSGGSNDTPAPLPPGLERGLVAYNPLDPLAFNTPANWFDPTAATHVKRANPKVLGVVDWQADLVRGAAEGVEMIVNESGVLIGIIKTTQKSTENDVNAIKNLAKGAVRRAQVLQQLRQLMAQQGGMGMGPGAPGGGEGMPGPSGPGAAGAGRPGGGMGMGMGMGPRGPGGPGGLGNLNEQRGSDIDQIFYVATDAPELTSGNARLAYTQMPTRMVIVNASFPIKQQLEEMQRALRLGSLSELVADPNFRLQFTGFNVQRRKRALDGKPIVIEGKELGFEDFPWVATYGPLISRATDREPNPPKLAPLIPPEDQKLFVPLIKLSFGKYPDVRLKTITDALAKLEEAARKNQVKPENPFKKLGKGDIDPFETNGIIGAGAVGGAGVGPGEGRPGAPGVSPRGPGGPLGPNPPIGPRGPGPRGPGEEPYGTQLETTNPELVPDYWLVRFVDADVQPGFTYDYRLQVKMANPNFGLKKLTVLPQLADMKELTGDWVQMPEKEAVRVESENLLFAVGQTKPSGDLSPSDRTQVQMLAWKDEVRLSDEAKRGEPVGDWVVTPNIDVHRGEFVGKQETVKLPLWSSSANSYVIRDAVQKNKPAGGRGPARAKAGVEVDFRTRSVVVDFEGGRGDYAVPNPGRPQPTQVGDDCGIEILILNEDGRLMVRNSAVDRDNPQRTDLTNKWEARIRQVEEEQKKNQPDQPFGPGGPRGPGGSGRPGGDGRPGGSG